MNTVSAEFNFYTENVVSAPMEYEAALDRWMQSDGGKASGYGLTLFSVTSNGSTPATHVLVAQMESYKGVDKMQSVAAQSADWNTLQNALSPISRRYTEGHAQELMTFGRASWKEGDHLAAIAMQVRDQASYQKAFAKLLSSPTANKPPGMIRLMKTLEAGQVTHYVLVSASSFAELNHYLDDVRAAEEFTRFEQQVTANRKLVAVRYIKVQKVW
ncbi:hypothetical protein HBA55_13195 [Pseudomaricurvus alkylphenolicus]|uniref:hypothetical protein n=1 Tax=Pseudomaricurvus alkylphenolicus TaxID=1306991 RepID=UPI00141E0BFF|nr:hypothetical protein [Pseudomaricurvus alkylphenolicus]NIB40550.1 hypothetical protein [Pseudomaricurvus alkylphenolicus]